MARGRLRTVIDSLRRAVDSRGAGALPDAELLERFAAGRDQAAFELLLWRHGPMVLGICRRVLRHDQDSEDAFQATFLTLVRKAGSVARREAVAGWLARVAFRVALAARAEAAKRPAATAGAEPPAPAGADDLVWRDLRPVLDEEVSRLPEKYRLPFVLCYLEGKTNEEAARELGCPKGTVLSRLAWARRRLRARLTRRGLTLSAGLLAATVARRAPAAVPAPLVEATARAGMLAAAGPLTGVSARVADLTKGALRAMWLTNLKTALAVGLAAGVLGTVLLGLAYRARAAAGANPTQGPAPRQPAGGADPPGAGARPADDARLIQGVWQATDMEFLDAPNAAARERLAGRCQWVVTAKGVTVRVAGEKRLEATYALDPTRTPRELDLTLTTGPAPAYLGRTFPAIYALDGDTLKVCARLPGAARPADFARLPGVAGDWQPALVEGGLFGLTVFRRVARVEAPDPPGKGK
jgi:RNA polymerase sigma factor (sigma-70 family)